MTYTPDFEVLIREFNQPKAGFPLSAFQKLYATPEKYQENFHQLLNAYKDNEILPENELTALFCMIHVYADKRDTQIFLPILDILAKPEEDVDLLFGDSITEHAGKILIGVFNGTIEPLERLIENPKAYEYSRIAAMQCWTCLVLQGDIPLDTATIYLKSLSEKILNDETFCEDVFSGRWIETVLHLRLDEKFNQTIEEIYNLKQYDLRHPLSFLSREDAQHIKREMPAVGADTAQWLANNNYEPFQDAIAALSKFNWDNTNDSDDIFMDTLLDDGKNNPLTDIHMNTIKNSQYINHARHIGRNDPCICGSGKKFKKCCMQ